jgi:hypothetical protein
MKHESEKRHQSPAPKARPTTAAPGAPTAPAEAHVEPLPETVECAECRVLIPTDEAVVPEALDYILYFCSPGCHQAWEKARAEPRENVPERPDSERPDREHPDDAADPARR